MENFLLHVETNYYIFALAVILNWTLKILLMLLELITAQLATNDSQISPGNLNIASSNKSFLALDS